MQRYKENANISQYCAIFNEKIIFLIKYLVVHREMCTFAPVQRNERLERVSHFRY